MVHFNDTFRALFIALEDWVVRGTEPPASQVPRLADGTLVRPDKLVFPAMKGLSWSVGGVQTAIPEFRYLARHNGFALLDFGPQYVPQDESGIATLQPPRATGKDYAILVPQVDAATGAPSEERGSFDRLAGHGARQRQVDLLDQEVVQVRFELLM